MGVCGTDLIGSLILPVIIASIIGVIIILIIYLYSKYANDNRFYAWAKIEIYQLGISLVAFITMVILVELICQPSLYSSFANTLGFKQVPSSLSFMDAANDYLTDSASYSYKVVSSSLYFYAIYSVASRYTAYLCSNSMGPFTTIGKPGKLNEVNCIMGSALGGGGGAGLYVVPMAGYGTYMSVVSFIANTALMALFLNMTSIFLFKFATTGIMFFLFPLGLLMRMIPFSRRVGAALMSIGFAFVFVYPLVLSVFYIDHYMGTQKILFNDPKGILAKYSSKTINSAGVSEDIGKSMWINTAVKKIKSKLPELDKLIDLTVATAHSFILSVFIPTLAFIITLGALNYMLSLLGVELDLSRLLQMV